MIYEVITDKYGNEKSRRNIFNATMQEMIPKDRRFIEKVEDRGRFGVIIYKMNGDVISYTH